MTNREKFEEYLQREVDLIKRLTDEQLALCVNLDCHKELWAFAFVSGEKWEYVEFGDLIPPGQHERIVKWLRKENNDDD